LSLTLRKEQRLSVFESRVLRKIRSRLRNEKHSPTNIIWVIKLRIMEAWVLKKREEQRLEAAQMKLLTHIPGITKLDKEKNQCIREKPLTENMVMEIKQ
jgi:hypothetical protein